MTESTASMHNAIKVSLVIPVRNEAASIQTLFNSIKNQTRKPDEIVFVDGGSKDSTLEHLLIMGQHEERVRIIEAGEATPGRGRNVGIAAARFEWVALTDAGIHLEPNWLEQLVKIVDDDPEVIVVYGNYEPITNSFFERCAALAYPPPKQLKVNGSMRGPSFASALIRRDVWEAVGGFPDLRAAEDLIFMERIRAHGAKIGFAPTATVWWQLQPTLSLTFRKFIVYSRYNVQAGWQQYWHYGIARQYALGFLCLLFAFLHSWWWLIIALIGAAARVAKSIWVRRDGRGLLWALNPVQFVGVGIILATVDLAMFIGWVNNYTFIANKQRSWASEKKGREDVINYE
jgi:glycosyltransferase involved in cell wall biosynthesis